MAQDPMIHLDLGKAREEAETLIHSLDLAPGVIKAAIASALNKTMRAVRTQIIKKVATDTGAKQKLVRTRLNTRAASAKRPSTSLTMYVHSIPVSVYGFRQLKKGISTKRGRYAKAFFRENVQSMKGRTRDKVLERQTGAGRYPLFERRIAIIDEAIVAFELNERGVFEKFHDLFMHELRFRGGLLG